MVFLRGSAAGIVPQSFLSGNTEYIKEVKIRTAEFCKECEKTHIRLNHRTRKIEKRLS